MSSTTLPENLVCAFAPVEDPDTGFQQIRIVVDEMDVTIGTSLVVLGIDEAVEIADRLNRQLGWTRESWTGFASTRL